MKLYPVYKQCLTVKDSYEANFKSLTEEQLIDLCKHNSFLEKVHAEMLNQKTDNDIFSKNLDIYFKGSGNFDELLKSVYKNSSSIEEQSSLVNTFLKKSITTGQDLIPVLQKIQQKTDNDLWLQIKECLYEKNTTHLRLDTLKSFIDGFSFEKISSFKDFNLAINRVSDFVYNIWEVQDFTLLLNACKTNEKFVFLLLFPYFFKPLGNIIWPTLLVHFNYVSGSFSIFIARVFAFLKKGNILNHTIRTISITKTAKISLGIGNVFGITLYNMFFLRVKKAPMLIYDGKLYQGFNGFLGSSIKYI